MDSKSIKNYRLTKKQLSILLLIVTMIVGIFFMWLYSQKNDPFDVFSLRGGWTDNPEYLYSITGSDKETLKSPLGVAVSDNKVFVADTGNHTIRVFDGNGEYLQTIGSFGNQEGQLNYPTSISVQDDLIYVADFYNNRIQVFDEDGKVEAVFSKENINGLEGDFKPVAITVNKKGMIIVSDLALQRIVILDSKGKVLNSFGQPGNKDGELAYANGLVYDDNVDLLYVSDTNNARIKVFSHDGKFIKVIKPVKGLATPRGIALNPDGDRLVVMDTLGQTGYLLDLKGNIQGMMGAGHSTEGLLFPNGVAVDESGKIFIADRENNRIAVFR